MTDAAPQPAARTRAEEPRWQELVGPWLSVVMGLALACAYAFLDGGVGDFCLDDAWIHLAYAKSLRLGDGLSYNPGDWQTGFSSPLWVLMLSVWPTGADPVIAVKLLGALLHAATAGLASAIALDLACARASVARPLPVLSIALLAGCLCATAPTLLQGASSGMEVPLATCLLLGCLRTSLREQWLLAGVLGFACVLARPELLACLLGFAIVACLAGMLGMRGAARGQRPALLGSLACLSPVLGAALGMGAWMIYCRLISGFWWPNTAYVKVSGGSLTGGLDYLAAQVLPWQPWYVGVGGLALIAAALWTELSGKGVLEPTPEKPTPPSPRRWQLVALIVAYLAGMLATAASRALDSEILFYQARYFAVFAPIPTIVIALGIARTQRVLVVVLCSAIAIFTAMQIPAAHALQRAQERGVALLHGDPALFVRHQLAKDAVIAVEGAGAMRYRTPRTMTIVDIIGLNDAAIAHAPDDAAKACVLIERAPGYMVLPSHIAAALDKVFVLRPIARFADPAWAQVERPHEVEVLLLEVVEVRPHWRARCR